MAQSAWSGQALGRPDRLRGENPPPVEAGQTRPTRPGKRNVKENMNNTTPGAGRPTRPEPKNRPRPDDRPRPQPDPEVNRPTRQSRPLRPDPSLVWPGLFLWSRPGRPRWLAARASAKDAWEAKFQSGAVGEVWARWSTGGASPRGAEAEMMVGRAQKGQSVGAKEEILGGATW